MRMNQLVTLMIVIQLWQARSGADPPSMVRRKVKVCFHCNDSTAYFNWTHPLNSVHRIQWKFKDIYMANYTDTALDLSQEALRIKQNYKGRFNLLKPDDVGFNLTNVTRADIGTYRCIVTLRTGVGETLEGVLEERYTDRQKKVEVCNDGNAIFKWTWGYMSFSLIQWQVNGTTFARTTKTGFSTDSLDISADYKPRFRLLNQGDVGFQLDHVTRNDAGTYRCIITSQSPEFTIVGDLEWKDQQIGDFNIMVSNQRTLTCGESRYSTYSWIFSYTFGRKNETSTGHELPLSLIPQNGSVYCQRQSDCTRSLRYSFSSVPLTVQTGQDKEITLPSKGVQKYRRYFVVFHATNILEIQHVTIYSGKLDSQPEPPYDNRFRGRYRVTSYLSGRPLAFVLRNITEADAGVYSCQDDAVREIQGCENLLVVAKQPSRPVIPHAPATLSGSDVLLSCNSTSRSLPAGHLLNMSSVWRRNNITVDDMDGLTVEGLELRITYIQAGHNGDTFSCQTHHSK